MHLGLTIYAFRFAFSVIATYDPRVYLVWSLLGIIFFLQSYIQSSVQLS